MKKIDLGAVGKENFAQDLALYSRDYSTKPLAGELVKKEDKRKPARADNIKLEEAHEPLLQENPHRFVLFPIKYHEVCTEVVCMI